MNLWDEGLGVYKICIVYPPLEFLFGMKWWGVQKIYKNKTNSKIKFIIYNSCWMGGKLKTACIKFN